MVVAFLFQSRRNEGRMSASYSVGQSLIQSRPRAQAAADVVAHALGDLIYHHLAIRARQRFRRGAKRVRRCLDPPSHRRRSRPGPHETANDGYHSRLHLSPKPSQSSSIPPAGLVYKNL
jgi:hypothetical protein